MGRLIRAALFYLALFSFSADYQYACYNGDYKNA